MFARVTVSPEHTLSFAEEVGKRLEAGTVILYEGDLGAGKTTFTKGLAKGLGITETITSPTFALVNEYYGRLPLFHFDLYRINSIDDLYAIGFFDYLDRGGIIAAEWSENIPELEKELKNVVKVRIDKLSDTERRILLLWS
ncbi:MAG: tRNA (adenosine(37)-N6)-threonylcarbamoyltransferase complex ATPase subunit type 1 TsaE [Oscillospiraceae bacterium]|nr:tRNA (adenosine(37)-N6)-threonylcarbamoyltransferase complex ATPase subunit type 1 TsaE [Oscillospiraceae bacterium]